MFPKTERRSVFQCATDFARRAKLRRDTGFRFYCIKLCGTRRPHCVRAAVLTALRKCRRQAFFALRYNKNSVGNRRRKHFFHRRIYFFRLIRRTIPRGANGASSRVISLHPKSSIGTAWQRSRRERPRRILSFCPRHISEAKPKRFTRKRLPHQWIPWGLF